MRGLALRRSTRFGPHLLVFALVLLALVWKLGDAPLSGTEPHRAIAAHQMLESGDWLVPRLWGVPYLAKPPLQYWVLASAERVAGQGEWTWRLPSAISSALLAFLLCAISWRWFGPAAGPAAGLSFLALVALWSQGRKADVDAVHALAVVAAALCLLELGCRAPRRAWAWMLAGGLAFGASLLAKGPAGLPVVAGAVAGPAIANRDWTPLRRWTIWAALAIGVGLFAAWAAAVNRVVDERDLAGGWSGITEITKNLTAIDGRVIVETLTVPLLLAVYSFPVCGIAAVALSRSVTEPLGAEAHRTARGVAGAIAVALALGLAGRVANERYMYVVLPLLCPLAGAVASSWRLESFGRRRRAVVRLIIFAGALVAVGFGVGLAVAAGRQFGVPVTGPVVACAAAVAAGGWVGWFLLRRRDAAAVGAMTVLLLALSTVFATYNGADSRATSSYLAGLRLREIIGDARRVTAGHWVLNGPELFYYAGVDVEYHAPNGLLSLREFDGDRWIVLQDVEWAQWSKDSPQLLSRVTVLPTRRRNAIAAWYTAPAP